MEDIQSSGSAMSAGSFFTPLLISMVGIVSTAIIIVFYHLVLIKYCHRQQEIISNIPRRSDPISGTGEVAQLGIGVDKNILATIPILAYSKIKGEAQSECVVCLGEFHDGDMVRLLPNCRHAFHITCIDEWFLGHSSCPVCRSPIVAPAVTVVVPLPLGNDINEDNGGAVVVDEGGDGFCRAEPRRLLRHCVSMALPPVEEKWPRDLVMGLKRSLSMDQSHVLLNIQSTSESDSDASDSSSFSKDRSYGVRSMRQLDSVSSILLRSFSRLQMGRSSTTQGIILPY